MQKFLNVPAAVFSRLHKNEDGTQLVETAIWLGIISAAAVTAILAMGPRITTIMTQVQNALG